MPQENQNPSNPPAQAVETPTRDSNVSPIVPTTVDRATSVQIETLRSKTPAPISLEKEPPESIKGKTFELDDSDAPIEYKDHPEAAKNEEFEKAENKGKPKVTPDPKPEMQEKLDPSLKEPKIHAKLPEKKEEVKEEVKVEDEATKKTREARDYSVFPEEIQGELRNTSNKAFNFIKEVYPKFKKTEEELTKTKEELKKIEEGGMPSQWYSHPEAWRLHPEAQKGLNDIQKIEFEEGFWREQLQKIQLGEQYVLLRGYNNQGQPVYSAAIEPSEDAKTDLLLTLGKYANIKTQAYVNINTFAQGFKGAIAKQEEAIQKVIDEEWPWHADEKHPAQKWVGEFRAIVPPERQDDYMTKVASLLYASYQKALELLEEKMQGEKQDKTKTETRRSVEPSVQSPSVGAAARKNVPGVAYRPPPTFDLNGMT